MSKIVVELENENHEVEAGNEALILEEYQKPAKKNIFFRVFKFLVVVFVLFSLVAGVGGFAYWQYLKTTPQYSLALLVDAAKREDQEKIDELIDTDVVVDDFVPQIIEKAVDIYGRGLAPSLVKRITSVATPFIPVVKKRARAEFPGLVREKTERFEKFPIWALAIGANRYLTFERDGDIATVTSKIPDQELNIKMKRNGNRWQIIGFKDDKLATRIARKIGQEMIGLAKNKGKDTVDNLGRQIGIPNLGDVIDKTEEIFK